MPSTTRGRSDEQRAQGLAAGLFLLLFTSGGVLYTLGAAVGSALFISSLAPAKVPSTLPWVYVGASVANVATALVYDRLLVRVSRMTALLCTQLSLGVLFSASMLLWVREEPSHYYVLTIGLDAASLLSLTLFFGFAADYFNPRDARRLYGLIGGGLAVGTVLGGYALSWLVPRFGVPNLVHVCALVLAFNAFLCVVIARVSTPVQASASHVAEQDVSLRVLTSSRFVRLVWTTFVLGMVLTVASAFQMQWMASAMPRAELASFFGHFYAWVGGVELVVQFLLVPWLLRTLGVVGALMLPPVLVGASSWVMQSASAVNYLGGTPLAYSAVVNGVRLTLEETLTLPARELLFLPLPARVRSRAQTLAGAVLAPLTRGLAGLLLIAYVGAGFGIGHLSVVVMLCALLLFVTMLGLRAPYRKALFDSLRASGLGADDLARAFDAKGAEVVIADLLRSEDERVVAFTLELVGERRVPELVSLARSLSVHSSSAVAARALAFLGAQGDPSARSAVELALESPKGAVVAAAALALARLDGAAARARLSGLLDDRRAEVVEAALRALATMDDDGEVERRLTGMLASSDVAIRARAVALVERIREARYGRLLEPLLRSSSRVERIAAARAAAVCATESLTGLLVEHARRGELAAADFGALGPGSLGPIAQLFGAGIEPLERRRLLLCVSHVTHPDALELLLAEVASSHDVLTRALAAECARAWLVTGAARPDALPRVERLLERDGAAVARLLEAQAAFATLDPEAALLFGDHAKVHVALVLSLAAFYMTAEEHERMRASLASSSSTLRASALELLDAALPRRLAGRIGADVQRALADRLPDRGEGLGHAQLAQLAQLDALTCAAVARAAMSMGAPAQTWLADPEAQQLFDRLPDVLFLKRVATFASLGADYLVELAAIAQTVTVPRGKRLFERGDEGDALYVVREGALAIELDGREVARLSAGEPLGELALLDGELRSAAAVAAEDARLLRIPVDRFRALLESEPRLRRALLTTLYARLRGGTALGNAREHRPTSLAPRMPQVGLGALVSSLSILEETELFGELSHGALFALAASAHPTSHYAGETLYRLGEPADALYVVCSGKVVLTGPDGVVHELTRGEVFGEGAIVGKEPRHHTAVAREDGQVIALRTGDLARLLDELPEVSLASLRHFARRLRAETEQRVAQ